MKRPGAYTDLLNLEPDPEPEPGTRTGNREPEPVALYHYYSSYSMLPATIREEASLPRKRRLRVMTSSGALLLLWLLSCGGSSTNGSPGPLTSPSPTPTATPAKLMVVTHTTGFRHSSITVAEPIIRNIGVSSGLFDTEFCRDAADVRTLLTTTHLASVDAVFFANTTGDLGIPDVRAFVDWVSAGHAFLGAHSASDTYHESPEYIAMLGGEFLTHGAIIEGDVRVDQASDPIVAHLAPRFKITDELYRFTKLNGDLRVLYSLDREPPDGVGVAGQSANLPLAWTRTPGTGRVFYTALGHREEVWQDARYQQMLREAIRWALRR